MPDDELSDATSMPEPPLLPPLRAGRLLTGLTGEESSRRFNQPAPAQTPPPARTVVKRTYELEDAVVQGIRRQALALGVNANDLANALLAHGLQALGSGELEASIGILPEEQARGPRATGRYITGLKPTLRSSRHAASKDQTGSSE